MLYPIALIAAIITALIAPSAGSPLMTAGLWLLPLPAVVDWTLEHLGIVSWSPRRQIFVTALAAPALGIALAVHAQDPFTLRAVGPMTFWLAVAAIGAIAGNVRRDNDDWEERHEQREADRLARLRAIADD